ncbi:unnamed protein product, partial [Coregonus sp. 'balchen']
MNHLREYGIVHRDIKPGNIMRVIGEDGRSVYKLTDFGAARELEDDEQFVSLYGTEEYLHPDMYERAVLRKEHQKKYGATVDLWSIGVTFFHAATGSLPFRPFEGPRRNKEVMGPQGACDPRGLQCLLTPVLANIWRGLQCLLTPRPKPKILEANLSPLSFPPGPPVPVTPGPPRPADPSPAKILEGGPKEPGTPVLPTSWGGLQKPFGPRARAKPLWGLTSLFLFPPGASRAGGLPGLPLPQASQLLEANPLSLFPRGPQSRATLFQELFVPPAVAVSRSTKPGSFLYEGRVALQLETQPPGPRTFHTDLQREQSHHGLLSRESVATRFPPKIQPRYDLDWMPAIQGDVGHLWKTSDSLLVCQELVRKGVRGLIELMKEDYSEMVHKKSEVIHLCHYCTQILERTEQLYEVLMQANMLSSSEYDEISDMRKKIVLISNSLVPMDQTVQDIKSKFLVERIKVLLDSITAIYHQQKLVFHATKARSLFTEECAMKYRIFISKSEEWMRRLSDEISVSCK